MGVIIVPDRTATVVVIAHNVEGKLQQQVRGLMDVLPELASWFEVIVIDDGSTDDTWTVANELASRYPQLQVIRRNMRYGELAAVRTASQLAQGDVLIIYDATDAPAQFQTLHLMFRRVRPTMVASSELPSFQLPRQRELELDRIRVDQDPAHTEPTIPTRVQPLRRPAAPPRAASHDAYFAAEEKLRSHFRHANQDRRRHRVD
jgi:hypothetical protein